MRLWNLRKNCHKTVPYSQKKCYTILATLVFYYERSECMNNDFRLLQERLEEYDRKVSPRFWLYPVEKGHEMDFRTWKEFILSSYGYISDSFAKKVYESVVYDKETGLQKLVQLRLCDVFNLVEGSIFEMPLRRAVMRCVYGERKLDREISPVMNAFYEEQEK